MKNELTSCVTCGRLEPLHRGSNPFKSVPMPFAFGGFGLSASQIFREHSLASHLDRNADWLQGRPRTSNDIEAALYPEYTLSGMEHDEVRSALNRALWDAEYTPSNPKSDNPAWYWLEGESL